MPSIKKYNIEINIQKKVKKPASVITIFTIMVEIIKKALLMTKNFDRIFCFNYLIGIDELSVQIFINF